MHVVILTLPLLIRMDPRQQLMQEKDAKRFEPVEIQPSRLFQWAPQTGSYIQM